MALYAKSSVICELVKNDVAWCTLTFDFACHHIQGVDFRVVSFTLIDSLTKYF
jgi:hypothetical protein